MLPELHLINEQQALYEWHARYDLSDLQLSKMTLRDLGPQALVSETFVINNINLENKSSDRWKDRHNT
jgi:hypothetical protein